MLVQFANRLFVSARGFSDPSPDPLPDLGVYLDGSWSPKWPSTILEWPDFNCPVDSEEAARIIRESFRAAQGGCRVEVGCGAGIGRTGTVLACMAVLDGYPVSEVVAWVRDKYHGEAVEERGQCEWIGWFAEHVEAVPPAWSSGPASPPAPWLALFIAYVSLLYHEARNVRFLIREGHFQKGEFPVLVSLPTNRDKAWIAMAEVRRDSAAAATIGGAVQYFEDYFRVSLEQLAVLFAHGGWKHSQIGGNAWGRIAEPILELREALDAGDPLRVSRLLGAIPNMSHNTGRVGDKLRSLNAWSDDPVA